MLYEILLSLSGHPSALFDDERSGAVDKSFPLLSPPETALLATVGKLSRLHRDLRPHTSQISASHASTICRAVATSIQTVHLRKFQEKILAVEEDAVQRRLLYSEDGRVVPLAGLVGQFGEWSRLMQWYWELCCFISPIAAGENAGCTGPALIDKLRQEAQTGYPDIKRAALSLSKCAELVWMRQLSTWVLYGRLPAFGGQDFFVRSIEDADGKHAEFEQDSELLPKFVSPEAATSILFIGRSLNYIRSYKANETSTHLSEVDLLPSHLALLSEIAPPIPSSALTRVIGSIRLSLSRHTLQQLLPLPKIVQILAILREFFLLGRGEFAVALISEADEVLRLRSGSTTAFSGLKGMLLKETEVNAALNKVWSVLAAVGDAEDYSDDNLELARDIIQLTIVKSKSATTSATIKDAKSAGPYPKVADTKLDSSLLSVPTTLVLNIPTPFDLFITTQELDVYSSLHAYLLAIRRAHVHLVNLWRESFIRREHPTPLGPPASATAAGQRSLRQRRERSNRRNLQLRKVWATCRAAVFLLSELSEHFEGNIVNRGWDHLRSWMVAPMKTSLDSEGNTEDGVDKMTASLRSSTISRTGAESDTPPRDPEMLANAHQRFLATMARALLITDAAYMRLLQSLLANIDALVAYLSRLQSIYQNLDLEEDEGVADPLATYARDRAEVELELDRSRKRVDSDINAVVARLRDLEVEEVDGRRDIPVKLEGEFEPLAGLRIENLLIKLDFRAAGHDGDGGDDYDGRDLV